jgi:hypothetical protein
MVDPDDRHDVPAFWAASSGDWHSREDESPSMRLEEDKAGAQCL